MSGSRVHGEKENEFPGISPELENLATGEEKIISFQIPQKE